MNELDMDSIFATVMVLVAATLAVIMLNWFRSYARHKRHDLRRARESLHKHFNALEAVLLSPVPSDNAKKVMVQFSTAINQRSVATAVAASMLAGRRPILSEGQRIALDRIIEEIRILALRDDSTAQNFRDAIGYGFAAMFIRWPETEMAMSDVVVQEARSDVREKAEWVISEIDDIAVPLIMPVANPTLAASY